MISNYCFSFLRSWDLNFWIICLIILLYTPYSTMIASNSALCFNLILSTRSWSSPLVILISSAPVSFSSFFMSELLLPAGEHDKSSKMLPSSISPMTMVWSSPPVLDLSMRLSFWSKSLFFWMVGPCSFSSSTKRSTLNESKLLVFCDSCLRRCYGVDVLWPPLLSYYLIWSLFRKSCARELMLPMIDMISESSSLFLVLISSWIYWFWLSLRFDLLLNCVKLSESIEIFCLSTDYVTKFYCLN